MNPNVVIGAVAAEFAGGPVAVEKRNEAGDLRRGDRPGPPQIGADPPRAKRDRCLLRERSGHHFLAPSRNPAVDRHHRPRAGDGRAFIRDELFLPFRSTKSGGYGIGAFQTRELIRMAGGDLEVISEKGFGTTMRIILPLVAETEAGGILRHDYRAKCRQTRNRC